MEIEQNKPSETFNIHFGEKWAEEVLVSLTSKTGQLLDDPDLAEKTQAHFFNRLYQKNQVVNSLLRNIRLSKDDGALQRDELLFQLMAHLLKENQLLKDDALGLPVVKKSSREEILNRLFRATDYIYANYSRDITLDELTSISCLSKFHFLRLFKQMFHQTPHQFVASLRIKYAKKLLLEDNSDIKSVASRLGFRQAGSFSRLFFNQTGVYPQHYRMMN